MSAISVLTYVIGLLSLSLACPDGWVLYNANDMCYNYIGALSIYDNAARDCERRGAELPMPKNKGENDFLHNLIKHDTMIREWSGIWLHATDRKQEGKWVWNNGNNVQWTNWLTGEPNNRGNGEQCVTLTISDGKWHDVPCNEQFLHKHVCVKPRGEACYAGDITKYDGKTANTESGRLCQRWDTNTPHVKWPKYGPTRDNYCRYTDDEVAPWCYTTDPNKRWEYCVIPPCSKCPKGWTLNLANYICYLYVNALTTYKRAVKNCQRLGAVLPMAKNERENAYLYSLIKHDYTNPGSYSGIWLDASDIKREGRWVWVDGEVVQWSNWYPGNPNNLGDGEHCVTLTNKGLWHDVPCKQHWHRHVCVKPPGKDNSSARMISQVHQNRPRPNPNPTPYRPLPVRRYSPVHQYSSYRRSQKVNTDETKAAMLKLARMIAAIKKRMAASYPKQCFRQDHSLGFQ